MNGYKADPCLLLLVTCLLILVDEVGFGVLGLGLRVCSESLDPSTSPIELKPQVPSKVVVEKHASELDLNCESYEEG